MLVQQVEQDGKGSFFVGEPGNFQAELVYSIPHPDRLIIEHTEVSDSLRGQHVGNLLLDAAIAYAREKKLKVVPACSFAAAVMKKNREQYLDVL